GAGAGCHPAPFAIVRAPRPGRYRSRSDRKRSSLFDFAHEPIRKVGKFSASCARGGMAEWLKALAWKACIRETVSWVRIPLPPPSQACPARFWAFLGDFHSYLQIDLRY